MTVAEQVRGLVQNTVPMSLYEEGSSHPGVKDVTKPGAPALRTKAIRSVEEHGKAPVLWNPTLNRGTNFTQEEREARHLEGLLPPAVENIELQAERVLLQLRTECPRPLDKYELLSDLAAVNATLLYYVLIHNLEELAPVVYTPTVGEACQKFDRIYRAALGMYFDVKTMRGRFRKVLDNWPSHMVQIIVVTDGGRILGLGDLGANGMGIPIGKIQLYIGGGGFHPEHSLPALLDCGTDNKELLDDKFYLGAKRPRLRGEEHLAIVEEWCMAVKDKWPDALIQFEDFNTEQAFLILERMRERVLCFNDDIQGTGAVVTTGFINGMKVQKTPLKEAKVLFYGAGSSAVGVALSIAQLVAKETGISTDEAKKNLYMVDSKGLITTTRGDKLASHKQALARSDGTPDMKDLVEIVRAVKPHALVGLTGAGPAFTKEVVEELCKEVQRPLIFPLSNPTSQAEITAENAYEWSRGTCLFAAGSPFDPYTYQGTTFYPGQANNVFIFPGVGFGAVMSKARVIRDEMLLVAARALADYVSPERLAAGKLYPDVHELREVSATVATAVAEEAHRLGLAKEPYPQGGMAAFIRSRMWEPLNPELNVNTPLTKAGS